MKSNPVLASVSFWPFLISLKQIGILLALQSRADWCKNKQDTAFCGEELEFGTVMEDAIKSKTGYKANYYQSWLFDMFFSLIVWL